MFIYNAHFFLLSSFLLYSPKTDETFIHVDEEVKGGKIYSRYTVNMSAIASFVPTYRTALSITFLGIINEPPLHASSKRLFKKLINEMCDETKSGT